MITPAQCRAARALLDWTQPMLSEAAGIGLSTVVDFEKKRRTITPELARLIEQAFEESGVVFIPENGEGAGLRLRKKTDVKKL